NLLVSRETNLAQGFETFVELPYDFERNNYATAPEVNQQFLDWLHRAGDVRFLAYLHYMEPHTPYAPPKALRPAPPAGIRSDLAAGDIDRFVRKLKSGEVPPPSSEV